MLCFILFCTLIGAKGASTLPVVIRLDPVQYHNMTNAGVLEVVDLWMTADHLQLVESFDPDIKNRYYLYTRKNPSVSQELIFRDAASVKGSNYSPLRPTAVLIHGWKNDVSSRFNTAVRPAFLAAEDMNVIVVDWSAGADTLYAAAVINTVASGESVARFINWLNEVTGVSLGSYHLVGHSLGGQQVGVVGRNLGGKAAYITALDPAEPGWIINKNKFRANDGAYTEVIHTNAGFLGFKWPLGQVDFYPNGGSDMAGCSTTSCDHSRSYYYFAESLVSNGFTGTRCSSYDDALSRKCNLPYRLRMGGMHSKIGQRGVYYLETNAKSPFSKDKQNVKPVTNIFGRNLVGNST